MNPARRSFWIAWTPAAFVALLLTYPVAVGAGVIISAVAAQTPPGLAEDLGWIGPRTVRASCLAFNQGAFFGLAAWFWAQAREPGGLQFARALAFTLGSYILGDLIQVALLLHAWFTS